ncbi:aspartyl-phosphate phosphatase Spo0E family protein [Halobacillus sp. Marseille-P3879]|uniref:Spo0E family sporulation regulatory protein-aspartic acid phosphatase n=1 Tax=Halobacillus sp. Marseille-P3879 TaxID=2045014 RepID=UPI000C7B2378
MNNARELKVQIERLRNEMHEEYRRNPKGQRVLRVSQQLDKVLNRYQRILNSTKYESLPY